MRACTAAAARAAEDRPGSEPVAGYRLVARVGSGGAGDVWLAEAPGGLRVALKIVPLGGGLGRREMGNLRILRAIRHPNLLAYFGAWQRDGRLIIGMELADRSLWDRFLEARVQGLAGIPMGELLGTLGDVARVVDFLNEPRHQLEDRSGVAIHHRDIKPQNIMLIGQGVKVADFGLSCLDEPGGSARSQCGLTFAYAAPETFRRRVSATSDQYSLAVTYCQLRSGHLPFVGPPASVMMGHLFGDPDLSALPEPERPVVARALAKRPEDRWPDCRSFLAALAGCAAAGSPDAFAAESALASGPVESYSVESRSVEIPPLAGSWCGATSDSSDTPSLEGVDIDVSVYCLGAAPFDDPGEFLPGESSSTPTVVVAAASALGPRGRAPRLLVAAATLLLAGVAVWSLSARPHTHAGVPVPSGDRAAMPATTSRMVVPSPSPSRPSDGATAAARGRRDPLVLADLGRGEATATTRRADDATVPGPSAPSRPASTAPMPARGPGRAILPVRSPIGPSPAPIAAHLPDRSAWRPAIWGASAGARTWLTSLPAARWPSAAPPRDASTSLAQPPSAPDVRLGMPAVVEAEAGRNLSIPIRLNRGGHDEPLEIHFRGLPAGVTMPDLTIAAGHDRATAAVRVRLDAAATTVPVTMFVRGESARAEASFRLKVLANPAMLHRTRGHTLLACGRPAEAVAAFTRAMEAGVSDPFVYNNRGLAYFALDQLDLAIRDYTEACRLRPDDPAIRYNRGIAYARRGDDVRALLDLDTAIRLKPDYAYAYDARARIYQKQGDTARSRADSTRAIELARPARPDDQPPSPCPPPSHASAGPGPAVPAGYPPSPIR